MACFRNGKMSDPSSTSKYTFEELRNVTLDDGTRVVTSPVTDIKRPVCAGIDVHKKVLMAAICVTDTKTLRAVFYVREFTSSNSDIRRMADWLKSHGVEDVCMESTGKYWIPVYDILEQNGLKPTLTHPKYVKQPKGRKTDFRDAIHIANLFRMDLVSSSFIPPQEIRDLRELCRYRLKLTYMRTSEKNRYQNSMTISKVRLDSVFSDPFGKSARNIMSYLLVTDPDEVQDSEILDRVRGKVKASNEEILDSIHDYEFIGVQRDKLKIIGSHIDFIDTCIAMIDEKLGYYREKYKEILDHLKTMVGISGQSALYILSEIGTDMSVWRDSANLASWAGLSPANNESAKKKKSTKIGKGGHYLKPLLVQCALAAIKSKKKQPYFYYKYETLKKRRGHKKAVIAIARKMLVSIYHMIKDNKDFQPIDIEQVVTRRQKNKELNLTNVMGFLWEQGVDEATIHLIKEQCSKSREAADNSTKETETASKKEKKTSTKKQFAKKKQPVSDAASSAPCTIEAERSMSSGKASSNQSVIATA